MINILKNAVYYSTDRVSVDKLNLSSYVSTENLIQNKLGKTDADKLPTQNGKVTGFIENDILVANIRPYLKKIWYANISGGSSTDVLTFRVKDTYIPEFVYYTLFRDEFFQHMMNCSKGTKMPRGDKTQILNFPIPFFEKNEQKKIAKVLSLLDKKTALNNKINTELEAMAKLIYDYWFVQFDFPDVNGKPYKSSGGKMVYNEVLKREIPEGWEADIINEVIDVKDGTHDSPKPTIEGYHLITSKNLKIEGLDFDGANLISKQDYESINKRSKVDTGDILFSMIGSIGTIYMVDEETINFAVKNVALYKSSQKEEYKNYIYMYLKSYDMQRYMGNVISGSIQKFIGLGALRNMPILIHDATIKIFERKTEHIFRKLTLIKLENKKLSELRDWLLPMLMNGQVTVKDV